MTQVKLCYAISLGTLLCTKMSQEAQHLSRMSIILSSLISVNPAASKRLKQLLLASLKVLNVHTDMSENSSTNSAAARPIAPISKMCVNQGQSSSLHITCLEITQRGEGSKWPMVNFQGTSCTGIQAIKTVHGPPTKQYNIASVFTLCQGIKSAESKCYPIGRTKNAFQDLNDVLKDIF